MRHERQHIAGRAPTVHRRSPVSYEKACGELAGRLRSRFLEIEAAVLTRIREKAPIDQNAEPEYIQGLREAIRSAIKYTLSAIEAGEAKAPPIPLTLLGQARLAARHGVALGSVLCRYTLGAHQISDLIVAEVKQDAHLLDDHLQRLLREQTLVLERVLLELAHEYGREPLDHQPRSLDGRLAELVKQRLAGEPVDMSALHYQFDRHHIGVVSQGCDAEPLLRNLASAVDAQLLRIRADGEMIWAWIGTRHPVDPTQLVSLASHESSPPRFAIGESETGSLGWCRTHWQAREAFPYLVREQAHPVRYADVALKAALENHDLAPTSLHQLYIAPLRKQPDDTLLPTLRAYFAAGHNGQAAAGALGVSRQTVSKRLRTVEAILRRPLEGCCADLEIALRLEEPTP